jgi:D-arabinose 5-phosphate isomerase GutQ
MMAMGDAIACLLVNLKRLTTDDFYKNHPGGELSKL